MRPVVRDLYLGIKDLQPEREVFVEAKNLRAAGVPVSKEKKWVEKDPATGDGDFEMVDVPDSRPIRIQAGELKSALDAISTPAIPKADAAIAPAELPLAIASDENAELSPDAVDAP